MIIEKNNYMCYSQVKKGMKMIFAKFYKLSDSDKLIISYVPVLGWKELNNTMVAMVPSGKGTIDAGYLFPVISETIVDTYGHIQSYYDDFIEYDIQHEYHNNNQLEEFFYSDRHLELALRLGE